MRKLVVSQIVSLDGRVAGPGGNVLALPMDAAFDAHNLELLRAADGLVLGADSYRGFVSYWPGVADAPADPANRGLDDVNREISKRNSALPKLVVSDTLTAADTGPWRDTTEIVPRAAAAGAVAALTGNLLTFGSGTTWNGLLAAGLVDELRLLVAPVVLGDGPALFTVPAPALTLRDVRTFPGSDNVLHVYEVVRSQPPSTYVVEPTM